MRKNNIGAIQVDVAKNQKLLRVSLGLNVLSIALASLALFLVLS